ncbi:uncharacterized protein B0I36DRAFT_388652 [Microdochium trichocladiopsis]|uniref:Uncharacterized protein n=1 Tax=Microdochium trichocladiopsis TaxID=1682393 RepID=A0A9P8XUQ2_9PEZI|nr:uncharacterized protein B0I36DRAFT_388652 [Microdochium trichocladiopsis]KAH7018443.1 hypothetical protein B0I36DRAFT_388652 [Microdochium trichocladiopsis]
MATATHPNIWRKRHNLAAWIIQILGATAFAALSLYTIISASIMRDYAYLPAATVLVLLFGLLTIALAVTEIFFFAAQKLDPVLLLVFASIKTTVWGIYLLFVVITAASLRGGVFGLVLDLPLSAVVFGAVLSQLIITIKIRKAAAIATSFEEVPNIGRRPDITVAAAAAVARATNPASPAPPSTFVSTSTRITLPESLLTSAYALRCADLFWSSYLPHSQPIPATLSGHLTDGLSTAVRDFATDGILRKALVAIALTTLGRRDDGTPMKEEGMQAYRDAMEEMALTVKRTDPTRQSSTTGILAAYRLFSLHEAIHGDDDPKLYSWLKHKAGDSNILATRDPLMFTSGHAHALFVEQRLHLTMAAIKLRKKVFLAEPRWRTVPWLYYKKSPRDRILDILIDLPTMLEDLDSMKSISSAMAQRKHREQIENLYRDADARLRAWEDEYGPQFPCRRLTEIPDSITAEDLASAHLMTLYWVTCINVYAMVGDVLYPPPPPSAQEPRHGGSSEMTGRLQGQNRIAEFCSSIVHTCPVFCHPEAGIFRMQIAAVPLGCALLVLAKLPLDVLAAEREIIMSCLATPQCAPIRRFLARFMKDLRVGEDFVYGQKKKRMRNR